MKLEFKEWLKLKENGTTTADVAHFARPIGMQVDKKKKKCNKA